MTTAPEQTPEQQLAEAGKAAISLRNELDRMTADRNYHADLAESWKAQFHSAAAAASEYSEFWEAHQGEFDSFGNYIPHSQIDGDLRAAKAEIERLRSSEPLPACPFDKISPLYLTMPDDKPCPFCGQENTPDGPDKCRGADTRIMGEAADEIERLRQAVEQEIKNWERRNRDAVAAEAALAAALEVIRVAGLMANVCYNAKQMAGVPEHVRTWLANTQESFDRARDVYLAAAPPVSPSVVGSPTGERT